MQQRRHQVCRAVGIDIEQNQSAVVQARIPCLRRSTRFRTRSAFRAEQFELPRLHALLSRIRLNLVHLEQFSSGVEAVSQCRAADFIQRSDTALAVIGDHGYDRIVGNGRAVEQFRAMAGHQNLTVLRRVPEAVDEDFGSLRMERDFRLFYADESAFGGSIPGTLEQGHEHAERPQCAPDPLGPTRNASWAGDTSHNSLRSMSRIF